MHGVHTTQLLALESTPRLDEFLCLGAPESAIADAWAAGLPPQTGRQRATRFSKDETRASLSLQRRLAPSLSLSLILSLSLSHSLILSLSLSLSSSLYLPLSHLSVSLSLSRLSLVTYNM